MTHLGRKWTRAALAGAALLALGACEQGLDFDLRGLAGGFNTAAAARQATANRPRPDSRGVISYPNYQVAIARRGDTIGDVAARIGLPAGELANYNGISPDAPLRAGEVIALPRRVAEPSPATGAPAAPIDITSLAESAIERAGATGQAAEPADPHTEQPTAEPIRHKVEAGETAYSIARLYNVSVRALAQWNGLGSDLSVRAGQYLLIPVALPDTAAPGQGSQTPAPPSAATPLPDDTPAAPVARPESPNLGANRTDTRDPSSFAMPVDGKIIRAYAKGKNDGIGISAPAGTPVRAAQDGTVAAITRDTENVPIVVIKHANNMLTVYAGVDKLKIRKGDKVKRGQQIAVVRAGSPSFLHFEIRKGLESVDPIPFMN